MLQNIIMHSVLIYAEMLRIPKMETNLLIAQVAKYSCINFAKKWSPKI